MDQLFHNPGFNHIGQQILNQVNKDIRIQPKDVSKTWTQIEDFVQSNEKTNLMYFYSNFGLNHIGRKIFMELNFEGIQAAREVCKTWKNIIDDYQFWLEWNQYKEKLSDADSDSDSDYLDDEDDHYIGSDFDYRYLNLILNSFKVFEFNQESRELTKNAISLFCIRYLFLSKTTGDKWERNEEFYDDMWAKIVMKYLKMYKIHHLWASLLKIHACKYFEKVPTNHLGTMISLVVNDEYRERVFHSKYLKFDPIDYKIKALNNLINFCLNPNLKHIGQRIFSYMKFEDQINSRRVCYSFKKAIDIMWAENVGFSIPKFYSRLCYNRNSARKLIKQIQTAQKNFQNPKKRSGSPINQMSKKAKIVEEKASISWRPKDENTLRWTSEISKDTKITGKFGQISWKQNNDLELRWTQRVTKDLRQVLKKKRRKRANKYRRQRLARR